MIKGPKFSIIIPVYNVENYLSECLESVINQSLFDIEIICVNDGTKDRSREILTEYQKRDNRILIVDKTNGGLSSARNAGLNVATGEYVFFIDSDDYVTKNICEKLYCEILEYAPEIIVFGSDFFPKYTEKNSWLIHNLATGNTIYRDCGVKALLEENGAYPFVWRNCFKRQFLIENKLLFGEDVHFAEDLIFQFMAFPLAQQVVFISDKLYYYRANRPNSLMANAGNNLYQKYIYHIVALNIIADYWSEKGLFDKYSHEFMAWTVYFMGWDLYQYRGENKKELLEKTCEFWSKYNLEKCISKIPLRNRVFYRYILKHGKSL